MLKEIPIGGLPPRLYIFLPQSLAELEPANIAQVIGRLRMKSFRDKVINLQFREGRGRDVLTVSRGSSQRVYFDFPNTLLSLNSLIDYKMESRKNQFMDEARSAMGRRYIAKFSAVLKKLIERKGLTQSVSYTDKDLAIGLAKWRNAKTSEKNKGSRFGLPSFYDSTTTCSSG